MNLVTRVGLLAGASALTLTNVSVADTNEELQARIAELETKVAQMGTGDDWLTEDRAAEIRGLVEDVLADADTRSSLLQAGMTAGYDNGFVIGSADGNFALRINGELQVRFVYNNTDLGGFFDDSSADTNRWGFEVTRTKIIFSGNVLNPDWTYKFEARVIGNEDGSGSGGVFTSGADPGTFELEDAYIQYNYGNGWTVRVGQYKAPFLRETLVYSGHQLAVERSLASYFFTSGRVQGIAMSYAGDDQIRFTGNYNDGASSDNSPWDAEDTEFSVGGRLEWLAQGNWGQFDDFTSFMGDETGVMLGIAGLYQKDEFGTTTAGERDIYGVTVDGSVEFGGANLFAAFMYLDVDDGTATSVSPWGLVVQGGYFLSEDWEAFLRWEYTDFDLVGGNDLSLVTVGVNKYFGGHTVKWTTDVGYGLDELDFDQRITGWRADAVGGEDQVVVRSQIQLLF